MGITHCFNYVKKPVYNGKVERFSRILQEALCYDINFLNDLAYDQMAAQSTIDNLIRFYNYQRPHAAIQRQTPMEYMFKLLQRKPAFQKVVN